MMAKEVPEQAMPGLQIQRMNGNQIVRHHGQESEHNAAENVRYHDKMQISQANAPMPVEVTLPVLN